MKQAEKNELQLMPSDVPSEAISILAQMLVYKPNSRLHGVDLLTHKFFVQVKNKFEMEINQIL